MVGGRNLEASSFTNLDRPRVFLDGLVLASTVAVANTAIAKALIKPASSLFIAFLPIGLGGRLARTPMAPPDWFTAASIRSSERSVGSGDDRWG